MDGLRDNGGALSLRRGRFSFSSSFCPDKSVNDGCRVVCIKAESSSNGTRYCLRLSKLDQTPLLANFKRLISSFKLLISSCASSFCRSNSRAVTCSSSRSASVPSIAFLKSRLSLLQRSIINLSSLTSFWSSSIYCCAFSSSAPVPEYLSPVLKLRRDLCFCANGAYV